MLKFLCIFFEPGTKTGKKACLCQKHTHKYTEYKDKTKGCKSIPMIKTDTGTRSTRTKLPLFCVSKQKCLHKRCSIFIKMHVLVLVRYTVVFDDVPNKGLSIWTGH